MKSQLSQNKRRFGGHARNMTAHTAYVPQGIIPCSLFGCAAATALAVLLTIIMAAVIYKTADPAHYVVPSAFSALYISAFIGGIATTRLNGGSALLCGLLCGAVFMILGLLLSLFIPSTISADYGIVGGLSLRLFIIVCSVFGAFIGTTKKKSKNNKRKNHNKR